MLDMLLFVLILLFIVILWVMIYDSNRFVVVRHQVRDRRIGGRIRVVFLSDLHNRQFGKNNAELLKAIEDARPDAVLVGGDMINGKPGEKLEGAVELLRALKEKYPVYYANGNHEHRIKLYPGTYGDAAERYGKALAELGIEPLVNCHVQLPGVNLTIYGSEIDKYYYKRFTVPEMKPDYLPVLLLHLPQNFPGGFHILPYGVCQAADLHRLPHGKKDCLYRRFRQSMFHPALYPSCPMRSRTYWTLS